MIRQQIIIVDGYNVIGTWPDLSKLKAQDRLADARNELLNVLAQYRKIENVRMIVVFDAMYVPGIKESFKQFDLEVVFTQENQTADTYIESLSDQLNSPLNAVTVVTSDQAEQWTVFSRGAIRIPSYELYKRIKDMKKDLKKEVSIHYDRQMRRNVVWSDEQLEKLKTLLNKEKKHD